MRKEKIRVHKIEKKKLSKNKYAFLISRFYSKDHLKEYLVCLNYDFKSNTFLDGRFFERQDEAYKIFNYLVNKGNFTLPKVNKPIKYKLKRTEQVTC